MTFALGLICGFAIGAFIMNAAHDWFDTVLFKDDNYWLGRTCPPCDGHCHQGRDCPAGVKK